MAPIYNFLFTLKTMLTEEREKGATAVEYGLLVAGIAALIVLVVFAFGGLISDIFKDTCDTIKSEGNISTTSNC